ncbi:MAG TPA: CBS domain-containing protein [Mycobacteriales bacterium]|nr:CBS domain-containing protein [Mycobacteriales bacterium]
MRKTRVKEIMNRNVVVADRDTTFKRLTELFAQHGVGAIPIIDPDQAVVGIVSETDLVGRTVDEEHSGSHRRFASSRRRAAADPASTAGILMSAPVVTIWPDATLAEAARLMMRRHVTHLPVVDESGKLSGIVGRSDLLSVFLAGDEHIQQIVNKDVIERTMCIDPATLTVRVTDGVVTLAGQLERKSLIPITVHLTSLVDGVVGVIDHLTFAHDDSEFSPYPPRSAFPD